MKKTIALVFAALSVATFGCNKGKTDTANPDDVAGTPAETPADDGEAETPAADGEAETPAADGEGDAAAPE